MLVERDIITPFTQLRGEIVRPLYPRMMLNVKSEAPPIPWRRHHHFTVQSLSLLLLWRPLSVPSRCIPLLATVFHQIHLFTELLGQPLAPTAANPQTGSIKMTRCRPTHIWMTMVLHQARRIIRSKLLAGLVLGPKVIEKALPNRGVHLIEMSLTALISSCSRHPRN